MNYLRHLYILRHRLTPCYLGKPVSPQDVERLEKKLPKDWKLVLTTNDYYFLNWEEKTIELPQRQWTEELILHSIGTIVLRNTRGSNTNLFMNSGYRYRRLAIASEMDIWKFVECMSTNWNWKSKILKSRSLDWYRGVPQEYLKVSNFMNNTRSIVE